MRIEPDGSDRPAETEAIFPLAFFATNRSPGTVHYLNDPATRALVDFFESKGVAALKQEDRAEQWYTDWIDYQKDRGLYASVLSPAQYSSKGNSFDWLRYCRFLEAFAYCSPAHGYSLQVTSLGLFAILMGSNEGLKQEAVNALESGRLLAFGVSEKDHGSDLLANEFTVAPAGDGGFIANGRKYYIGNTDTAWLISVLGRRGAPERDAPRAHRAPFILVALRPSEARGFRSLGKIHTLGVRAANVGGFEVTDQAIPSDDVIAEGRDAWDAVFGAVTLGKFLLGFGSIGICEHAHADALEHLQRRILYGKPVIELPHIRAIMAEAYARLLAMKLYAYRALDYLHCASAEDRRYLLFCAVQKAKVSTEGVKVMSLMQEAMGARGFESDTFFEMALRDIQLIPSLEGSMHINLNLAAQCAPRYFDRPDDALGEPPSLVGGEAPSRENPYLMEAAAGALHSITFPHFQNAYRPLMSIPGVAAFSSQAAALDEVIRTRKDEEGVMARNQCFATIVFGQLVAEGAAHLHVPEARVSEIFEILVMDLRTQALRLGLVVSEGGMRNSITTRSS